MKFYMVDLVVNYNFYVDLAVLLADTDPRPVAVIIADPRPVACGLGDMFLTFAHVVLFMAFSLWLLSIDVYL